VFNTPAVHGCHGWKLGEYLALGKAIISTDLSNLLPEPLVHGQDIHFSSPDVDDLRAAIELLKDDVPYRQRLERSARTYWERHLSPAAVMSRILGAVGLEPRVDARELSTGTRRRAADVTPSDVES
jgi:glycosyltransferase involved in cell wall biosynthesis